jgi:hypothetical protein
VLNPGNDDELVSSDEHRRQAKVVAIIPDRTDVP